MLVLCHSAARKKLRFAGIPAAERGIRAQQRRDDAMQDALATRTPQYIASNRCAVQVLASADRI